MSTLFSSSCTQYYQVAGLDHEIRVIVSLFSTVVNPASSYYINHWAPSPHHPVVMQNQGNRRNPHYELCRAVKVRSETLSIVEGIIEKTTGSEKKGKGASASHPSAGSLSPSTRSSSPTTSLSITLHISVTFCLTEIRLCLPDESFNVTFAVTTARAPRYPRGILGGQDACCCRHWITLQSAYWTEVETLGAVVKHVNDEELRAEFLYNMVKAE
ncbi:hypothetical protein ARMGADRAFT_1089656 [Armillaria gallica]|uniref:Uncharacterized protein n=1 Tax=Armillaria gallica TaxID=47427 RepID=A0A2H3CNZ1_ARMGA|nr:hypothetical protein ARMGADRAFT_1089656 [Armillaria gallica]